ncbi:tRNA lysidine(34) synthetase TilS [Candidatus Binatia bacterium]|nr:tRNA lysidine(34) synthetase TilS [Candidatus Binatia bacterium]
MGRRADERFLGVVGRTLARHGMVAPGDRVLVAVSGGADSVALLGALAAMAPRLEVTLHAAHLHHGVRGAEADRDAAVAATVAERCGVSFTVERATDLPAGANFEARARARRYAFLRRVARIEGCARVATGHTRDDQAETLLMRLVRGAGRRGLGGMEPVRDGWLIRPLLACSRGDVLAFLAARGLPWCEDASNDDRHFLRNRVRHEVLPLLRALNPSIDAVLAATAGVLATEDRWLDDVVESRVPLGGSLPVAGMAGLPLALRVRVVRLWLRRQRGHLRGLGRVHLEDMAALAVGSRGRALVPVPGGGAVERRSGALRFRSDLRLVSSAPAPKRPVAGA